MGKPFDFLKTTNDWLEKVPVNVVNAFNNFFATGEKIAQEKVDTICVWLSWKVNIAIERKRQALIKTLYEQYKTTAGGRVMRTATAVKEFVSDPIGAIASFAKAIFAPIASVFEWIKMLAVEIPRLAENLAKIVQSLPPEPPSPHINYDKFKLKVGTINMSIIASDPSNMPAPEVLFPEPPKPFSKDAFSEAFETASANLKSTKQIYTLKGDDKKSMQDLIKAAAPLELPDEEI